MCSLQVFLGWEPVLEADQAALPTLREVCRLLAVRTHWDEASQALYIEPPLLGRVITLLFDPPAPDSLPELTRSLTSAGARITDAPSADPTPDETAIRIQSTEGPEPRIQLRHGWFPVDRSQRLTTALAEELARTVGVRPVVQPVPYLGAWAAGRLAVEVGIEHPSADHSFWNGLAAGLYRGLARYWSDLTFSSSQYPVQLIAELALRSAQPVPAAASPPASAPPPPEAPAVVVAPVQRVETPPSVAEEEPPAVSPTPLEPPTGQTVHQPVSIPLVAMGDRTYLPRQEPAPEEAVPPAPEPEPLPEPEVAASVRSLPEPEDPEVRPAEAPRPAISRPRRHTRARGSQLRTFSVRLRPTRDPRRPIGSGPVVPFQRPIGSSAQPPARAAQPPASPPAEPQPAPIIQGAQPEQKERPRVIQHGGPVIRLP